MSTLLGTNYLITYKDMKKDIKLELKITPVDNGFFIRTYEKNGDLRIPLQTLVATGIDDLFVIIKRLYKL